jgi:hypothetical protein
MCSGLWALRFIQRVWGSGRELEVFRVGIILGGESLLPIHRNENQTGSWEV